MTSQGRGGGHRRPVKGFRPGKEPPQIRKQMAKSQFGEVSAGQERLIEMLAERSPEEARRLLRRWRVGLLTASIILAAVGALLFTWSWPVGLGVGVLAVVALVIWWRIQGQREAYEAMVDAVSRPGAGKSRRKRPGKS